jgi:hypothetical protein
MMLGLAALAIAMVVTDAASWGGEPAGCAAAGNCDCEAVRQEGFAAQPANTVSNLGLVAVGAAVVWSAQRRGRGGLLAVAYGVAVFGLGVGSALFHGTATSWGGWADLVPILFYLSLLGAVGTGGLRQWDARTVVLVAAAAGCLLAAVQVPLGSGKLIAAGLGVTIVGVEWANRGRDRDVRWLAAALGVLGISAGLWAVSRSTWCDPRALLQAHGLWHLGAAVAAGLGYLYLRPALVRS